MAQRQAAGVRAGRWGAGGVAATMIVVALWWWSSGAADPVAPGAVPTEVAAAASGASSSGRTDPSSPGPAPSTGAASSRDGVAGTSALALVRAAAAATAGAPTATFTLTVALVDDGEQAWWPRTEVSGAVDARTGDVSVTLREWVGASGADPTTLEAVGVGDALYVRSPSLDLPGEPSSWWRTPVGPGQPDAPAAVSDLVSLVGSGVAAESLGAATEDGVTVTRYRVELAGTDSTAGLVDPAAGWALVGVSDAGLLRSVEVRAAGAWGAAAGRPVVVRLVLDALGDPVAITVPDPATVRDPAGIPPAGGD